MQNDPERGIMPVRCIRCDLPMKQVRIDKWCASNILTKQLQKVADSAGLRFYHCKQCGKIEFFK